MRDEFNAISYGGNDGTANWSADWQELGESDGPSSGRVRVLSSTRCASPNCMCIGGDEVSINGRGLVREADLTGASSATLTFSYRRQRLDESGGSIDLDVSDNGGSTWTTRQTYVLNGSDAGQVPQTFDITAYIASDTQIRFIGSGSDVESYFYADDVQIDFTIPPSADLEITKTVDNATPTEGDTIVYTVVLDNNGPDGTTNVAVTDLLPAGVTYVSDTTTKGSYVDGTGIWTVGGMANGASETLTITATVDAGTATTTIGNTASVSASDESDPTPGNDSDSADITVQTADLTLTKTDSPDPAPSVGPLLYTLLVTNNGPDTATAVTLTDTLPASTTFQSATPSQGSCSGTTTVTCNLGAILNGGTASVEILVTTSGPGSITNNASVAAHEIDLIPGDNAASENTDVVADSTTDIPLTQYIRLHGFLDHVVSGGSLRTQPNSGDPCAVGISSSDTLSGIPATASVQAAYLYWSGSGVTPDNQVTLDGVPLTADRVFEADFVLGATTYEFFGGFEDVTGQVAAKRNGVYTFADLAVSTGNPWCSSSAVIGGWSLFVVYEETSLTGKTLVLYDGFDIARNGSTSYLLTGIYASGPPEAKTTTLLWEGDETLSGASEQLLFNATPQSDALNPVNNVYNSTINSLGSSTAYGMDLDTFDVSSLVTAGDTLATTQVDSGPDLVILNTVLLQVKTNVIVGTVFEDVNYGGGPGRDYATAKAAAATFAVERPNAAVELYDAAGNLLRSTLTDASGGYGFTGLPGGD
ncbi:MAG: DUF11 domain-containing protein, partial [bacterium]|nr:DUF11 domain-containing protein [bacterium]